MIEPTVYADELRVGDWIYLWGERSDGGAWFGVPERIPAKVLNVKVVHPYENRDKGYLVKTSVRSVFFSSNSLIEVIRFADVD